LAQLDAMSWRRVASLSSSSLISSTVRMQMARSLDAIFASHVDSTFRKYGQVAIPNMTMHAVFLSVMVSM
jgi:hypothetical protein